MRYLFVILSVSLLIFAPERCFAQDSKENADFKLAVNLYNDGMYDLASEQLRQFIGSFPSTAQAADARFYLGLCQLKLKKYDDARLSFQTFALTYQDNPRAPEAWMNVGEAFVALGNNREAALAFERVRVFHSKSKLVPDALVRAGTLFNLAANKEDAYRVLRMVVQEYSSSGAVPAARTQLGQMYLDEGNFEQAQSELKRVVDANPPAETGAQARLILGNLYQAMGQPDQAQATFQQIISIDAASPAAYTAYVNLGKLQAATGKYVEAVESFKKILGKSDSSLQRQALLGIGDAYAALSDGANAVSYYEKFIASSADNPDVHEVLWKIGLVGSRTRDYRTSNDACNRLIKSKAPDILQRRALVRLALNAKEQGNAQQAIQFYTTFLDNYPDDAATPEIMFRIAGLYEKDLRDVRKAAQFYELLFTRYPRSPYADDAYAGAARSHEASDDFTAARQLYHELIQRFPSSDFRLLADERIEMIETFEIKEKDAGLEKLAVLIGDIVGEKDKAVLAYKLGEIYFSDLKNFSAAAAQFTNVINSGSTNPHFVDALLLRAKSYDYLSWKDASYRTRAIQSYQTFLKAYPSELKSEEAAFALFRLNATSSSSARQAFGSTLKAYPNNPNRDAMQLRLGGLLEESDSLKEALVTYSNLTREFPSSRSAEEALFRSIGIQLKLGLTDTVTAFGGKYLAAYPNGAHTASIVATLAELAMKSGDIQRAVDLMTRLDDEFAYTSHADGARAQLADALLASGKPDKAVAVYKELVEHRTTGPFPETDENLSIVLGLAKAYQASGNNAEAKRLFFQLLAKAPSGELAAQAYTQLGLIYRTEGSPELATSFFRRAATASPNTPPSREIADLLFDNGDFDDAIKQYGQLLGIATTDADRQFYESKIIMARLKNDDVASADKEIPLFTKKYPKAEEDLAQFELEKGSYAFRKKDMNTARKSFERVASKYDETSSAPEAMYWIGKILEASNKNQDAVKQFNELIGKHPKAPITQRAFLALGNMAYNAEKWDDAIKQYRRVVDDPKADPEILPYAMSNLIETYEIASLFDAALTLTRKYLELYPRAEDSFDKKVKIGILYQRLGFNDQSVMHLQGLLNVAGGELEGELRYYIAEANYNRGDYQQAVLDFLKVPYLVTKKGKIDWAPNSLYMAGQSYEKMGRYDQALAMYQQIVERPGFDETFKSAAKKEIDRVKLVLKKSSN